MNARSKNRQVNRQNAMPSPKEKSKFDALSVIDAMFPGAIENDTVDVALIMRQCQYRAEAILDGAHPGVVISEIKVPDAIEAAQGYIAAANELIDA